MTPLQLGGFVGMNPLGPFGIALGLLGVVLVIYWTIGAWSEVREDEPDSRGEGAETFADAFAMRFRGFVIAFTAITITIGNQLIQLFADLVGMVDNPIVVGHFAGGVLGYLGVTGSVGVARFVMLFGILTAVVLVWRAAVSRRIGL